MNINEPLYAGFWRRALAILLDVLMLQVVVMIVSFPVGFSLAYYLAGHITPTELEGLLTIASVLLALTLQWLYFALMESSAKQATLGKMALGIRVTNQDGSRMSLGRASARYLSKFVSMITLIGFYLAGWTKRKQALHDFMRIPTKPATDSEVNRPGIPSGIGHPYRRRSASAVGRPGGEVDYAAEAAVTIVLVLRFLIESPARVRR